MFEEMDGCMEANCEGNRGPESVVDGGVGLRC